MTGCRAAEDIEGEDERCLVAARTNAAAFASFYGRRHQRVAGFFHCRILCRSTTEDLTAETFARVWATRGRFEPSKGTAMGWTLGVAHNLYRQWSRHGEADRTAREALRAHPPRLASVHLDHVEDRVDLAGRRGPLHAALEQITPNLRDAVLLRIGHDLPYDAVADRLGCSPGAARVRVSRGLDALHRLVQGEA